MIEQEAAVFDATGLPGTHYVELRTPDGIPIPDTGRAVIDGKVWYPAALLLKGYQVWVDGRAL